MPNTAPSSSRRTPGLPLLLFSLVAAYIVLQFIWWAWLLISKEREVGTLQQQLIQEGVQPLVAVRHPDRTLWMVAGEGGVFLLLVLLALWIIYRTVKHELTLARQQRDFLLATSHELRTPIAGMKLHLQTMQRSDLPPGKRDELATIARHDVDRLHALTERILLATRLDEMHVRMERRPVDAAAILSTVCAAGRSSYACAHTIEVDAPATLGVRSDGSALHSIMENLLENACKYSPAGSTVNVQLLVQGATWELRVADSGVGVPAAERTLIFRKFHRVGSEETRGTKGTGLGLFIVQRLTQALGGEVTYRPREPQGSTFVVTFPNP